MFENVFGKKKEAASVAAESSSEKTTQPIQIESAGKKEMPFSGGREKTEVIRLPDDVFVGSEARQREIEKNAKDYGLERGVDHILADLHQAEVRTEFPDAKGELTSRREYLSYVKTPDGRVHSTKASYESFVPDDSPEKKIVDERTISPEGQVRMNKRSVEKWDGSVHEGVERLAYDEEGNVIDRDYTLSVGGEVVYRTETIIDPQDPESLITTITFDSREGARKDDIGKKFPSTGTAARFRNGFDSNNTKLLEK